MSESNFNIPSHTFAQLIVALTALAIGFRLGKKNAADSLLESKSKRKNCLNSDDISKNKPRTDEQIERIKEPEESVDTSEPDDGDLSLIVPKVWEPCKLVLVVRGELKMAPQDIATQCSAATLACYRSLESINPRLLQHWEVTGQAKIALRGRNEEQLVQLEKLAKSLNLCARSVHDDKLTENKQGNRTVLAIGPAPVEQINRVTGTLRLL